MPETEFKTVGIAVDNFKVTRFKKALNAAGFNDLKIRRMKDDCALIQIRGVDIKRVIDIQAICVKLQAEFQRRN